MNRRLFFRALMGAPAAAIAKAPSSSGLEAIANADTCGSCQHHLYAHGSRYDSPVSMYWTCPNKECRQYDLPMVSPKIQMLPADLEIVRRVRAQERSDELEIKRQREAFRAR